jgi:hypothetical protein
MADTDSVEVKNERKLSFSFLGRRSYTSITHTPEYVGSGGKTTHHLDSLTYSPLLAFSIPFFLRCLCP